MFTVCRRKQKNKKQKGGVLGNMLCFLFFQVEGIYYQAAGKGYLQQEPREWNSRDILEDRKMG